MGIMEIIILIKKVNTMQVIVDVVQIMVVEEEVVVEEVDAEVIEIRINNKKYGINMIEYCIT